MKKDQREAEEVTMKIYLHKISLEKNIFSSRGFPLSGSGNAITRRMRRVAMVHNRAITRSEACRIVTTAMDASV